MRHSIVLLGVLAAALSGGPTRAQTPDVPPPPESAPHAPRPKPKPTHPAAHDKARASAHAGPPTVAKAKPMPPVPIAPPPPPILPPPLAVPVRPVAPPTPPAVVAGAAGEAIPLPSGLRITFAPGGSDLNPTTEAAIRALAREAPPFATTTFSIVSVAPGTQEDPSTPRRLSLSRALAVRGVLITEGIPSARIYVRAMGATPQAIAGGPPDRADITVAGATPATAQNQGGSP